MKNTKTILACLSISLCFLFAATPAEAGILSALSKLGKAAKKVDAPTPTGIKHLELPKAHKNLDSAEIVPNANGSWDVRLSDGRSVSLENLKVTDSLLTDKVLIIRSLDIPKNPSLLKQIPDDVPIYISGKNNRLFSLGRGSRPTLNYKNVSLQLNDSLTIQKAIYHLEKPLFTSKTRFVTLVSKTDKTLESTVYGSKVGIEAASLQTFIRQLDNLKHQSIVLAGSIKNGIFYPKAGSTNGIPLSELRKAADKNGINLAILDSDRPANLLKLLSRTEEAALKGGQAISHSIGDFFNNLSIGKNSTPIKIASSPDGRSNVAIQFNSNITKQAIEKSGNIPTRLHLTGLLLRSSHIYRPNAEQDAVYEEEIRLKTQKQNLLILYPVLSLILGWMSATTSRFFWSKIWNIDKIGSNGSVFFPAIKRLLNRTLFVILFLPLFGGWCFSYAMISTLLKVLHTIFIKPVLWAYAKLN